MLRPLGIVGYTILIIGFGILIACQPTEVRFDGGPLGCDTNADCGSGLLCINGLCLLPSDGDLPDGDLPDGDLPDGDLPDGDLPDGDTPDGDTPDGDVPDGDGEGDGDWDDDSDVLPNCRLIRPYRLDFTCLYPGENETIDIEITNCHSEPLNIETLLIEESSGVNEEEFILTGGIKPGEEGITLQQGVTYTVRLRYQPIEYGSKAANFYMLSDRGEFSYAISSNCYLPDDAMSVSCAGSAVDPDGNLTQVCQMPIVHLDEIETVRVEIANNTPEGSPEGVLAIHSISLHDPDFPDSVGAPGFFMYQDDLDFNAHGEIWLQPGETKRFSVYFKPPDYGLFKAELHIEHSDPSLPTPFVVRLSGQTYSQDLCLSPGNHDFGTVYLGSCAEQEVCFENCGGSELEVSELTIETEGRQIFQVVSLPDLPLSLPAETGQQLCATIQCCPQDLGLVYYNMWVKGQHPGQAAVTGLIELSARGLDPGCHLTVSNIDFGPVPVGTEERRTTRLTNNGPEEVDLLSYSFDQDQSFTLDPMQAQQFPRTLQAGEYFDLTFVFKPGQAGLYEKTFLLAGGSEACGPYINIQLRGTGIQSILEVDNTVTFGQVQVMPPDVPDSEQDDWRMDDVFTLCNSGNLSINVYDMVLVDSGGGYFTIKGPAFPQIIPAGGCLNYTLGFLPPTVGTYSAQIIICSDAYNSVGTSGYCQTGGAISVDLFGTGISPNFDIQPNAGRCAFNDVLPGDYRSCTLVIRNTGIGDFTISDVQRVLVAPNFSIQSILPAPENWPDGGYPVQAGNNWLEIEILYHPQTVGTHYGFIKVQHSERSALRAGGWSGSEFPYYTIVMHGTTSPNPLGRRPVAVMRARGEMTDAELSVGVGETVRFDALLSFDYDDGDAVEEYEFHIEGESTLTTRPYIDTTFNTSGESDVYMRVKDGTDKWSSWTYVKVRVGLDQ